MTKFGPGGGGGGLPDAADPAQARVGRERWQAAASASGDPCLEQTVAGIVADPAASRLVDAIFGNSPYLTFAAEREPALLADLLTEGFGAGIASVESVIEEAARNALAEQDPSRLLRIAKRRLALTVALADLGGAWPLEKVTGALSDFAEQALRCAASFALVTTARRGGFELANPADPERQSGLIVLGMGKLGARELNYSSDIDLIVFYDPERIVTDQPGALQQNFVRLSRLLVKVMSERTADGYVFRTDLRLRPDPGSTPPAISVLAAEAYYETMGQNWERAAMIKARPVAGNLQAGADFLGWLRPFVWRKHLDFAAIDDIHSIKRQINASRGGDRIAIAGHNIKLGRGGIREIEFFAQTQQLIWGGRLPALRIAATVDALAALVQAGKIAAEVARELTDAYRFLRRLEHRLQMINDEQTHVLPADPGRLRALAVFFGYAGVDDFSAALLAVLRGVESHYAELFEDAPALTIENGGGGNLVFTGGDSDPETLVTLERMGFANPHAVDGVVRGWHHGRYRAMRSARARELLTELLPQLLKTLSEYPDPDAACIAFDRFLSNQPAGIQLFSMFNANPHLLGLLIEILGRATALADHLSRHPSVLESVLSGDFFDPPPAEDRLLGELNALLSEERDQEGVLDVSRRWAHDRRFQVGVQLLRGIIDTPAATSAWSHIADAAIRGLHPRVAEGFAEQHGIIPGCDMAILAMGKLGGREMTTTSDLDLIFVYATPSDTAASNGRRPLAATQYFARLSQRLINALTAPTAQGCLYEVDMRLRPSGNAGPIATSLTSFQDYQQREAWTWEAMAMTRARVIAGPPPLAREIEAVILANLTRQRDPAALVASVAEMRERMDETHHTDSLWEVKYLRGGMVDIEFIAQYLQLLHAHAHPRILSPNTMLALDNLREHDILDRDTAADLMSALSLWQAVQNNIRLTIRGEVDAQGSDDAPETLRRAMEGVAGLDFDSLVERMTETAKRTHQHFVRIIDSPGKAAGRQGAE